MMRGGVQTLQCVVGHLSGSVAVLALHSGEQYEKYDQRVQTEDEYAEIRLELHF